MLYSVEGLRKDALLKKTAGNKIFVLDEAIEAYHNFSQDVGFDIFLSYRSLDADVAIALAKSFQHDFGYTVYLDRLIDPNLNPSSANKETARKGREMAVERRRFLHAGGLRQGDARYGRHSPSEGRSRELLGRVGDTQTDQEVLRFRRTSHLHGHPPRRIRAR